MNDDRGRGEPVLQSSKILVDDDRWDEQHQQHGPGGCAERTDGDPGVDPDDPQAGDVHPQRAAQQDDADHVVDREGQQAPLPGQMSGGARQVVAAHEETGDQAGGEDVDQKGETATPDGGDLAGALGG